MNSDQEKAIRALMVHHLEMMAGTSDYEASRYRGEEGLKLRREILSGAPSEWTLVEARRRAKSELDFIARRGF